MGDNAPKFDPLNPTPEEAESMYHGYCDGIAGMPRPLITDHAYDHGRRMGENDKAGVVDDDQRELAQRAVAKWRNDIRKHPDD